MNNITITDTYGNRMATELDIHKHIMEGHHRTAGSYVLISFKSLLGYLDEDPNMRDIVERMNSEIAEQRFNEGYKIGVEIGRRATSKVEFEKGILLGATITGVSIGIYYRARKCNERKDDKNNKKENK